MSKNTSVSLGDHFNGFVEEQVTSGRFASASEVIRAGLRLLEAEEAKLQKLRALIREGEESGAPVPLNREKFFAEMRAEAARRDAEG
ncbi:MAG TPA: type II toxin-antitoxin system ParD family antitoxin [Terricaulis sp.]|nr:type II toxin-antitoxin system ParD family antitoxin [Terricaulis sp.]HRP12099.1 type II toxin-antitoxin system ParD family antitoxin [Terricaulis sp.]